MRPTEASLKRLPDFSFTGDNVFYTGFYFDSENNMLVEANKIDPKLHNDSYLHLKEMLGLKEVEAPVINNGDKKRKINKICKINLHKNKNYGIINR